MPTKVFLSRNRCKLPVLNDTDKGFSRPQPLQAVGFDDNGKSVTFYVLMLWSKACPVLMIPAKVYPGHNRCKQPVLMIGTKAIF